MQANVTVDDEPYASGVINFFNKFSNFTFPILSASCVNLDWRLSYLRIPAVHPKKGGGLRVKRLMLFDKGLGTSGPELYGTEYIYESGTPLGIKNNIRQSSGVATNEPESIHEENILVGYIPRLSKNTWDKVKEIISGRDKKQFVGPIGKPILPAPSVGYSKVITKNIHSGRTHTGYNVNEYRTCRYYPFLSDYTPIDVHQDYLPLPTGIINKFTNNRWASQGYVFKLNKMHGQLKKSATYSGDYNNVFNPVKSTLVASVEKEYFEAEDQLPVMDDLQNISYKPIGREAEVVMESRAVKDKLIDGNIEFDIDAGIFGIVIVGFGTFMPSLTLNESEMYSHVTSKVITYPVIEKSVKSR